MSIGFWGRVPWRTGTIHLINEERYWRIWRGTPSSSVWISTLRSALRSFERCVIGCSLRVVLTTWFSSPGRRVQMLSRLA